ncbi:hypothetical protein Ddye_022964 [Dipteronia dyeriana]|uniref:Zinc finger CCCH domain-containing protein 55 n=1 Tax=Dipteronia dyeriana TaxID=168575 RepID=A0AAD9TS76_9ROSI|nr:hypothetical protein Ddye_022964 [Dipteronia dyeriana]
MDQFVATSVLFDKVKSLDSENASKIMGYILIQDFKEGDLVSLAFGPETLLQSLVFKARIQLGLSSNTMSTTIPTTNHHSAFPRMSPRVANNGGFVDSEQNLSFSDPKASPFLSFDNIRSGSCLVPGVSHLNNGGGGDIGSNSRNNFGVGGGDFVDEFQFNDYLSFLNETSKNEEFNCETRNWGQDVNNGDTHLHRRSFSASDVCFGTEDASFGSGYAPCHYFARGFCKNGDNCKFVHGDFGDNVDGDGVVAGSPSKMNGLYLQLEEMMRLKAEQQQRLAASQFAAAGVSSLPYDDKRTNFLLQQQIDAQREARAAMMLGDEFHKFGCGRPERNDFFAMGLAEKLNSASRQIYLTFPADSTFKDEDVSNYFRFFGPVQDVRIPYQQRRMFGFVTFLHPETVKLVLTRGNPHFICDSRVLVKPYKEKGKAAERRQQQFERGNFSPCSSPSGVDSMDPYDLHLETTNIYHTREMMFRRKLEEQVKLQQAIEFQRRRFMNLQLPDLKNHIHHHQRSLSVGSPVTLHSHDVHQNVILPCDGINQEVLEGERPIAKVPSTTNAANEQHPRQEANVACLLKSGCVSSKEGTNSEKSDLHEHGHESNVENFLPDTLFASPTKKLAEGHSTGSSALAEVNESTTITASSPSSEISPEMPTAPTADMASHD